MTSTKKHKNAGPVAIYKMLRAGIDAPSILKLTEWRLCGKHLVAPPGMLFVEDGTSGLTYTGTGYRNAAEHFAAHYECGPVIYVSRPMIAVEFTDWPSAIRRRSVHRYKTSELVHAEHTLEHAA